MPSVHITLNDEGLERRERATPPSLAERLDHGLGIPLYDRQQTGRERRLTDAEQCRRCLNYASLPPTPADGTRARRFPDASTLRPRPDMSGWIAEPRFEYVE